MAVFKKLRLEDEALGNLANLTPV